jgi:acetolactate synthase regulatory subunit
MTEPIINREAILERMLRAERYRAIAVKAAHKAKDEGQGDLIQVYLDQARAYELLGEQLQDTLLRYRPHNTTKN